MNYKVLTQNPKKNEYLLSDQNVFPLKMKENQLFVQAQDYITNHLELNFNMKNFLSFFRIWNAVEYLKQPQFKFKASIKRVA